MNDLSDLNWDNKPINPLLSRTNPQFPVTRPNVASAPPLSRHTTPPTFPSSGRVTPASTSQATAKAPVQDSFASLLSSSNTKKTVPLSLAERQKQLLEEKARQQQPKLNGNTYVSDETFWEGLGSGRNTPAQGGLSSPPIVAPSVSVQLEGIVGAIETLIIRAGCSRFSSSE